VYRDCRWCQGRGCLYCKSEADKAYKAEFPDGPKPIATFDLSTPEGIAAARRVIGPEALAKAFGPGGGGVAEIEANAAKENPDAP
jgi:hypothetical protein